MTQLFATENEMREFFDESPEMEFKSSQITRDGILAFYDENIPTSFQDVPAKSYLVYTKNNGSFMYVSEKGTTFIQAEAKKFTWNEACSKSYFMSLNGAYDWDMMKI